MVRVWWCNQGKLNSEEEEYKGLTLWDYERHNNVVCSQYDENKRVNRYRESVGEVRKSDIIVHYVSFRNQSILAISRAKTDGREHGGRILTLPGHPPLHYDYYDDIHPKGWEFDTEYHDFAGGGIYLSQPLKRQIFELNMPDNPIERRGDGTYAVRRPGYFRPFTIDGLWLIYQAAENKEQWPDWALEPFDMSNSPPKVQRLSLENFTAFEKATFDFCPGINVLIGANATGKSHVMKMIYTLLKVCKDAHQNKITSKSEIEGAIYSKLHSIFQPSLKIEDALIRFGNFDVASVYFSYANINLTFTISAETDEFQPIMYSILRLEEPDNPEHLPNPSLSIYLPTQEFLSINEGFIATYTKRELPYDETYYDLSLALNALPLRQEKLADVQDIIRFLRKTIAGDQATDREVVAKENGRFYFDLPEGHLDVHLVAEGYRKIATLYYLLRNGSLTKDSILFWDEPEANLNPNLIVEVVKVLRMLASAGMQIFITTHDYLLSHELSLIAEYPSDDTIDIKFFALYKPDRTASVLVESGRTLAEIEHNPILEEFAAHYDRETTLFHQSAG